MPAALTKAELFARLEQGHAAQVTVVTPNRRLAQSLMADFDAFQTEKNLTVWEAPDILPFGAFVERLWEDALYSDLGESLPLLLTPAQEQHLWQEILKELDFLLKDGAAQQCREAWRLMHQWRIGDRRRNEDALAFSQWSSLYQEAHRGRHRRRAPARPHGAAPRQAEEAQAPRRLRLRRHAAADAGVPREV